MTRCLTSGLLMVLLAVSLTAVAAPAPAASPVAIRKHVLPNGLTVLVKDVPTVDLVAVDVLIGAGPRVEDAAESGMAFFTLGMILRGTTRRSAAEISLDSVGGVLRGTGSADYTELSAIVATEHVDAAIDLLADIVSNARFDPNEIETLKRINVTRIRQSADQPLTRALEMAGSIYAYHPYAKSVLGRVESVSALTRDRLLNFYRTFYTGPNMVVTITGNLRTPVAQAKVMRAFGGLRGEPVPRSVRLLRWVERALAPQPSQPVQLREAQRTAAAWIAISYLGVGIRHRDYAALRVLSTILGSGFASRLFTEIREKQGLAYQVSSSYPTRAGPTTLTLIAGTDPQNQTRVIELMQREVASLRDTPVSDAELERARNRVIGLHAIDHEDLRNQAFYLGWYELLGVGYEFDTRLPDLVARVTAADVQRVARYYLVNPVTAVVAPPGR